MPPLAEIGDALPVSTRTRWPWCSKEKFTFSPLSRYIHSRRPSKFSRQSISTNAEGERCWCRSRGAHNKEQSHERSQPGRTVFPQRNPVRAQARTRSRRQEREGSAQCVDCSEQSALAEQLHHDVDQGSYPRVTQIGRAHV